MIIKCKMCGGDIEFNPGDTYGQCDHCGSTSTIPKADDEQKVNRYNRANHFRRQCEFDKAVTAYERILEEDETDAEAHWGIVLSRYGIEYVEDPVSKRRVPTCHRVQVESILADADYLAAIENAPDEGSRKLYEEQAKEIAEIQKGILAISSQEAPYDVFICYKETDENGERTRDSALAQEVYYGLTEKGYKVFFSRITLEDKLGQEYEPYIFAALNSARVMLVIGTKPEYINAVWVKNEWSRYLHLMKNDRKRLLIPCYRNMDPYDLPDELSNLQSQDMSKIGFMQDLLRGIQKVLDSNTDHSPYKKTDTIVQVSTSEPNERALQDRAAFALEDGEFAKADEFVEQLLNINARNAQAYIYKLMISRKVRIEDKLADLTTEFDGSPDFIKAMRFGDEATRNKLNGWSEKVKATVLFNKKKAVLQQAEQEYMKAKTASEYASILEKLGSILPFEQADGLVAKCQESITRLRQYDEKVAKAEAKIKLLEEKYNQTAEEIKKLKSQKYKIETIIDNKKVDVADCNRYIHTHEYSLSTMNKIFASKQRALVQQEIDRYRQKVNELNESIAADTKRIKEIVFPELPSETEKKYQFAKIYYEEGLIGKAVQIWQTISGYKDTDQYLDREDVWPVVHQSLTDDFVFGKQVDFGKEIGISEPGAIKWIVLSADKDSFLLLSKNAVNSVPYCTKAWIGGWEISDIRNWLNNEFYNEAFSDNEKSIIRQTSTSPADAAKPTEDKVFILSEEEIKKYLIDKGQSSWLICDASRLAVKNGMVIYANMAHCWWWTRTTIKNSAKIVTNFGSFSQEMKDKKGGGVRPAIWVRRYRE